MYDTDLKEDLLSLNKIYNAENQIFYRNEMFKIIKCRTRDKIDLINFLLQNNVIDYDFYVELAERAKSDCRIANLYLMGFCSSLE